MKTFALLLLAALLPTTAYAQDKLHIEQVGLPGNYSTLGPTPVRIHIPALPQSQTIQLVLAVELRNPTNPLALQQTDLFRKQVQVTSGMPLDLDVPILVSSYGRSNLHVIATDSQKRMIGEGNLALSFSKSTSAVAIYCRDDSQCLEAQTQISPIRTGKEASIARNNLQFVLLKDLQSDWLAYRFADAVVIAGSISDLTSDQARALEYYLRSGGILALLEKEAAAGSFLAAYRQGVASSESLRVGKGHLYRVPSLESHELTQLFAESPQTGQRKILPIFGVPSDSSAEWVLNRIAVTFTFPPLRWLLIWVGVYILIIGPVNFAALRRLGRLEWGWATVAATALLFAGGIYLSSSTHRPKHFTLDGAVIYWMDGESPVAHEELGFRISSPERTHVNLTINGDVLLAAPQGYEGSDSSEGYLGSEITGNSGAREGWRVQLGPPLSTITPMRRWSLKDIFAEGFHDFAGTVHWTSATRLKNDTGRGFRQGLYLDVAANKAYAISGMAPNKEVDLASLVPNNIYGTRKTATDSVPVYGIVQGGQPMDPSFSLAELLKSRFDLAPAKHIFAGVFESAGMSAGLDAAGTTQQNIEVAIVALDQP